jgi:hypothetical protein
MFNFGVGGQEVKQEASEGIANIPLNRTFLIQKLTDVEPMSPQTVHGLKNISDVFNHFKPNVEVELSREDGSTLNESFHYSTLADFRPDRIIERSPFLKDLNVQREQYDKIQKQAKTNKILAKVLENPEARAAFLDVLNALSQELEEAKNNK